MKDIKCFKGSYNNRLGFYTNGFNPLNATEMLKFTKASWRMHSHYTCKPWGEIAVNLGRDIAGKMEKFTLKGEGVWEFEYIEGVDGYPIMTNIVIPEKLEGMTFDQVFSDFIKEMGL